MRIFVLSISLFAGGVMCIACGNRKTGFRGYVGESAPSENSAAGESPDCADGVRPTRTAFIVDNSGSHGTSSGTDPESDAATASVRGVFESFTYRQNAVYTAIETIWGKEKLYKAKVPTYTGSDLSLAYFPKGTSGEGYQKLNLVTGAADDTAVATKFSGITYDDSVKEKIWSSLAFTHNPKGMTPYKAVVDAALELLPDDAADSRSREVFLITDGLPTDQSPKEVMAAAAALFAKNIRVTTVYVFKPTHLEHVPTVFGPRSPTLQRIETTEAYTSLETAFLNGGWGQTDGYLHFADYWSALTLIPRVRSAGGISTFYIPLAVENLQKQIVSLIGRIAFCKPK
jgi:hypothetical protein